eukprot:TRINITY_DN1099_c0_g1_i1.p1 TRINITY_DN1099_c0_g1~~TRINITY_DN1099_c0_g1_i1.p1  ORF type:complete len:686 (+),score=322.64 TRINITY_DN1099_c0_g1_i1:125-2059(+)
MAEVDEIIVAQLKGIGVSVDKAVAGVGDFDAGLFYRSVREWMGQLFPGAVDDLPKDMPASMNKKFKVSGALAGSIQEHGYGEPVTFNQFMYPEPKEMRGVLLWLCEQQNDADAEQQQTGARHQEDGARGHTAAAWKALAAAQAAVVESLKERRAQTKVVFPPLKGHYGAPKADPDTQSTWEAPAQLHPFVAPASGEEHAWFMANVGLMAQQGGAAASLASIDAANKAAWAKEAHFARLKAAEGVKGDLSKKETKELKVQARSKAADTIVLSPRRERAAASPMSSPRKGKFQKDLMFAGQAVDFDPVAEAHKGEAATEEEKPPQETLMQQKLKEIKAGISKVNKEINGVLAETAELEEETARLAAERRAIEKEAAVAGEAGEKGEAKFYEVEAARELLESEDPLAPLQAQLDEHKATRDQLEEEVAAKREKLEAKHAAIEQEMVAARAETTALQKRSEYLKEKIGDAKKTNKDRKAFVGELEAEVARLAQDVGRDHFVERIFDILKNIRKQDAEVQKITAQTKDVTIDIAAAHRDVEKALENAAAACLEHDDKAHEAKTHGRLAHGSIKELHAAFVHLTSMVDEQGVVRRQAQEYDERVEKQAARNAAFAENAKLVQRDLAEIKAENAATAKEFKRLRDELRMRQ